MKWENLGEYVWEGVLVVLLAVVVAYSWIGHDLDIMSPLPVKLPITMLVAPLCGACVYLFVRAVRGAFYVTVIMCSLACVMTGLFFLMPAYQGIMDFQISLHVALRFVAVMAIYIFPFSVGGCWSMGYFYPE